MQFSDLPGIVNGQLIQLNESHDIKHLLIDSRKPIFHKGTLFFAIKGPRNDGHQYLPDLYQQGIRNFIVEELSDKQLRQYPMGNFIKVASSVRALQQIAGHHRQLFDLPVIAITGSNGKTIIKEWLFQLLSPRLRLVKSPKSFNSQVGVPLSLWQIQPSHQLGIFEAGISQPGEMAPLSDILLPTIGMFTNLGPAHDSGFESLDQKLSEKITLFKNCEAVIYCRDQEIVDKTLSATYDSRQLFSWSQHSKADVKITKMARDSRKTELKIAYANGTFLLRLPFLDKASIENCMHCVTCLLFLKYDPQYIQSAIDKLESIPRRLVLVRGVNECYLIDDSYNNDLAGLEVALDFLLQQKQKDRKTVILSDLQQSGLEGDILWGSIANLLESKKVDRLIAVGTDLKQYAQLFSFETKFFESTDELISHLHELRFNKELILIKGARTFRFEQITQRLQEKVHGTVLEINLDALTHNLNFFKSKLGEGVKVMAMVKAFAYGSGSFEVAHLLQYHGVDYLGVAYADEGVALRQQGIHLPIMVMNPQPDGFPQLLAYDLEPEVYSIEILQDLAAYLDTHSAKIKVHLKIDTGMHRLGFELPQLDKALQMIQSHSGIEIASMFSHLASAGDPSEVAFSNEQYEKLMEAKERLKKLPSQQPLVHLLNSDGILQFPQYQLDMVRLGIGLYGVASAEQDQLLHIGTLKARISQVKELSPGDTIGYGRQGKAKESMKIATITIGYADGFDRRFSNGVGQVIVQGKKVPVAGNVCMDMTMIDVTGLGVVPGEEVILFNSELTVSKLADQIGTIPYEILTNISSRVKRNYFTE